MDIDIDIEGGLILGIISNSYPCICICKKCNHLYHTADMMEEQCTVNKNIIVQRGHTTTVILRHAASRKITLKPRIMIIYGIESSMTAI